MGKWKDNKVGIDVWKRDRLRVEGKNISSSPEGSKSSASVTFSIWGHHERIDLANERLVIFIYLMFWLQEFPGATERHSLNYRVGDKKQRSSFFVRFRMLLTKHYKTQLPFQIHFSLKLNFTDILRENGLIQSLVTMITHARPGVMCKYTADGFFISFDPPWAATQGRTTGLWRPPEVRFSTFGLATSVEGRESPQKTDKTSNIVALKFPSLFYGKKLVLL